MAERKDGMRWDGQQWVPTSQGAAADASGAGATAKKQEASRKKAVAKSSSTSGMPKQLPGEDASAYSERLRKWREKQTAGAQASAVEQ